MTVDLDKIERYEWIARQKAALVSESVDKIVNQIRELRESLSDLKEAVKELKDNE